MITLRRIGRCAVLISPVVIVVTAFFAALPWLKTLNDLAVTLIAAAASIFVMGYANYLGYRAQRGLDEVHRAGSAFAAVWGAPAGQALFALLLLVQPLQDAAIAVVGRFAGHPAMIVDRTVVILAMTLGFVGVVLLETIGRLTANAIWWMGRR